MAKKKITVGAFFGLITKEGKLRLQRRIEKGSRVLPGISFQGDFELTGGGVKEKDLSKVLTFSSLFMEAVRETIEELGIIVLPPQQPFPLYRAVFVNTARDTEDWAFMIPVLSEYWNETAKMKRETIDVNPDELRELANRPKGEQLLSGWGKRMCRMSLGAFYSSFNLVYRTRAEQMLGEVKPDWRETEYFGNAQEVREALARFRKELE